MRKYIKCIVLSGVFACIFYQGIFYQAASALEVDTTCDDVEMVFARGSAQGLDDDEYKRFRNELTNRIQKDDVKVNPYELGRETYNNAKYPATSVTENNNWVGAVISTGTAFAYGDSVAAGKKELKEYLTKRIAKCPDARFILGGYSQGAQVVREALSSMSDDIQQKVDYMALFGDPLLYLPEGLGPLPLSCLGLASSPYRAGVPECHTAIGSIGAQIPYTTSTMSTKTGLWCNTHDFICGSTLYYWDRDGHNKYADAGQAIDMAAKKAAEKVKAKLSAEKAQHIDITFKSTAGTNGIDTVFVIDTTGSMSSRIQQAKAFARASAEKIKEHRGRVALVAYRDSGDEYTAKVMSNLQDDQTDFLAKLDALTVGGGGDTPEAGLHALTTALNGVSWKNGATKAAVVLTDAGYHNPDRVDGSTAFSVAKRALEIDPVNVYPVVPGAIAPAYQDLADQTSGQVIVDTGDTAAALTTALTKIVERPVVTLKNVGYMAEVGQEIQFDASDSYVIDSTITSYSWDFDGDAVFDEVTTEPVIRHTYASAFDGVMQVRATAANGTIATGSATVKIGPIAAPAVPGAPKNLKVTAANTTSTTATLTWTAADQLASSWTISVNGVSIGSITGGRTTIDVSDLNRSADITFAIAGLTADGQKGEASTVVLATTPATPPPAACSTGNFVRDLICKIQLYISKLFPLR